MIKNKTIDFTHDFDKQLNKAPLKIKVAFRKRLSIFLTNPFNTILHNHALEGKLEGHRNINITGDWRVLFIEKPNRILFTALGTHNQLYK